MTAPQPGPVEQERVALEQLIQAVSYARSGKAVLEALLAFPEIAAEAAALLLNWPPLRKMLTALPSPGAYAPVQSMHRLNMVRRAAYLVQAARRLTLAIRYSRGDTDPVVRAFKHEARFLQQHLEAHAKRALAANAVAESARESLRDEHSEVEPRGLVGWYAKMDERTSKECRKADGRNFDPTRVPAIGFPGAVHPHCRCRPGPPHKTDLRVEALRGDPIDAVSGRARGKVAVATGTSWRVRTSTG